MGDYISSERYEIDQQRHDERMQELKDMSDYSLLRICFHFRNDSLFIHG